MIKSIFFDFDGVLAESVSVKTDAFRQMYAAYGKDFSERVVEFHKANGGVSRFDKFKKFNGEWLGENLDENRIDELSNIFSDLVVNNVINAPSVAGADNFLNNDIIYKKYVISATPTDELKTILKGRNIARHFDGIYGSPENKSFWVKEILKRELLEPRECVFIGDAISDYNAAHENNVEFILRETPEGENLFEFYKGLRVSDLANLNEILSSL